MTLLRQRRLIGSTAKWDTLRVLPGPPTAASNRPLEEEKFDYRLIDTWNHTCPNHVGANTNDIADTAKDGVDPCEGCVAESYLLDWLTQNVLGLGAQVQELEAGKVDR